MILKTKSVWTYPSGREVCPNTLAGNREYKRRTEDMVIRQKGICLLCLGPIIFATFDHEAGRGMGGGTRDDRIEVDGKPQNAAVCWDCNAAKGSRKIAYHSS